MGKIVKYCSSCDEGFAEKFGFCPDCGAPLQAFEMNPLAEETKLQQEDTTEVFSNPFETIEAAPSEIANEVSSYDEPAAAITEPLTAAEPEPERPEFLAHVETVEEAVIPPVITEPAFEHQPYYQAQALHADEPYQPYTLPIYSNDDDGYHITVIQEKNSGQRNLLLLGSALFMTTLAISGVIISLFTKDIGIGAIGDSQSLARLIDEVPMPIDDEVQKKDKDKGGGGGGGGREEEESIPRPRVRYRVDQP